MWPAAVLAFLALISVLSDPAMAGAAPSAAIASDGLLAANPDDVEITGVAVAEAGEEGDALLTGTSHPNSGQQDNYTDGVPGEFSGDVTVISHYVFRGVINSDDNPAAQGSLSYSVDVGLPDAQPYVRFWGSNFDDRGEASVELDLGFGLSGTLADLEWDIGGFHRGLPGSSPGRQLRLLGHTASTELCP